MTGEVMNSLIFNTSSKTKDLASVVQRSDSAVQQINHYPLDKFYQKQWIVIYPVNRTIHPLNNRSLAAEL